MPIRLARPGCPARSGHTLGLPRFAARLLFAVPAHPSPPSPAPHPPPACRAFRCGALPNPLAPPPDPSPGTLNPQTADPPLRPRGFLRRLRTAKTLNAFYSIMRAIDFISRHGSGRGNIATAPVVRRWAMPTQRPERADEDLAGGGAQRNPRNAAPNPVGAPETPCSKKGQSRSG